MDYPVELVSLKKKSEMNKSSNLTINVMVISMHLS